MRHSQAVWHTPLFSVANPFQNYTSISSYSWSLGTWALISWPRKIPIFCSSSLPLHDIQEWILPERSAVAGRADFAHCCHRTMRGVWYLAAFTAAKAFKLKVSITFLILCLLVILPFSKYIIFLNLIVYFWSNFWLTEKK